MFYAKSVPGSNPETIRQHTDELLKRYEQLDQSKYPLMSDRDWELLKIAVQYHDVGKADTVFQNKIRAKIGEEKQKANCPKDVRHNFLSVMAVPYKSLGIRGDEKRLLFQAIGYHHENRANPEKVDIVEVYEKNILPIKKELEEHMGLEISDGKTKGAVDYLKKRITESEGILFERYVMIKGLLHRLDHSASASVALELAKEYSPCELTEKFLKKNNHDKRDLQQFAVNHQEEHLLILAQTGMGKTEAGLLWLGDEKGFFILPIRTSLDAMYKRLRRPDNIGFSKISETQEEQALGLLHSTSIDVLADLKDENYSEDRLELMNDQTRNFSNKLIISTIDQILKFAFLYKGFEKELATLSGAKLIIDEMQAYDPRLAALIVRALYLIDQMGGKFMIMTATMPDIYVKALERYLKASRFSIQKKTFYDDKVQRHWIKLHDVPILDDPEKIIDDGKSKKVLVICNTVKQAKAVYQNLSSNEQVVVELLHSQFTRKDRSAKETALKNFEEAVESTGIWVTTQLVEASLDIDFDVLYTEMSTLDSLFQRLGRCNRKNKKAVNEPNIHIFIDHEDVSGIGIRSVYHPEIYDRSLALIKPFDNQILLESKKMAMVEQLYDHQELEGSAYKKHFTSTLEEFFNLPAYELSKNSAQEFMREISQVQAIPVSIFRKEGLALCEQYRRLENEYQELYRKFKKIENKDKIIIEEFEKAEKKYKHERRRLKRQIEQLSVGVNHYRAKKSLSLSGIPEKLKGIYVVDYDYSPEYGLNLDKETNPFY